jgi:hypothetical protein
MRGLILLQNKHSFWKKKAPARNVTGLFANMLLSGRFRVWSLGFGVLKVAVAHKRSIFYLNCITEEPQTLNSKPQTNWHDFVCYF